MTHQEASTEISQRMDAVNGAFGQTSTSLEDGLAKLRKTAKVSVENKTLIDHINILQKVFKLMNENRFFKRVMNEEANALSGASTIKQLVTQMIERGGDFRQIIRMLSLESLLKGGLDKDYQKFVNLIYFNYGFQMVLYLMRLQEIGLLTQSSTKWSQFVKQFQLFVPDWEANNEQAAAPYLGYVPLSIRYIQKVLNNEFSSVQKAMSELKQESIELCPNPSQRRSGNVLVCFIGGCTHSELNALRRLELRDPNYSNVSFQVLTTNMTSSNEFFENIGHNIPEWDPQKFINP